MITAAVSEMLLVTDRNSPQQFDVDSPLTEEATKVIYKLPRLRKLRMVINGPGSLRSPHPSRRHSKFVLPTVHA